MICLDHFFTLINLQGKRYTAKCFKSNVQHLYFSSEYKLCDLSRENIPYKWTHGKWMDEKWIAKPFEMEWLIDEQMTKTFQKDEVERKIF